MDKKRNLTERLQGPPRCQRRLHCQSCSVVSNANDCVRSGVSDLRHRSIHCSVCYESVSLTASGFMSAPATTGECVPGLQSRRGPGS